MHPSYSDLNIESINYLMSVRRKSCDACFRGRRKCDLTYPSCTRCQKNQKHCRYIRIPQPPEKDAPEVIEGIDDQPPDVTDFVEWTVSSPGMLSGRQEDLNSPTFNFDMHESNLMNELLFPSVPSFLGNLGEVQPVSGNTKSWNWIIEQLKSYPRAFVQDAETAFIHKQLYRDQFPPTIRAAFGLCAAYVCMSNANESMLFQILDAEASDVLESAQFGTLLEALSRMQATLLYQTIRLYHGDLKQRLAAEQQESLMKAWGLQLLQRANTEIRAEQPTWEDWILAESIRRTVMVTFMLYAVYSIFQHGTCLEFPTLSILPVSTKLALWSSPGSPLQHGDLDDTMKYQDFTDVWLASPRRKLDPFEKTLLVACKGIEQVEALSLPGGFD